MRRVEITLAALALGVLAIGLALLILQFPTFTRMLSSRYSEASAAGMSASQASGLAEQVRAFVVSGRGRLEAADGFSPDAVSHLEDVGLILARARGAVLILAVLAAGWLALRSRTPVGRALIADALVVAGSGILASTVVVVAAGLLDFDAFFSAFHSVFFAAGTWTFPSDSVLIRLFPEIFWVLSGVAWATLIVLTASAYIVVGRRLKRDSRLAIG